MIKANCPPEALPLALPECRRSDSVIPHGGLARAFEGVALADGFDVFRGEAWLSPAADSTVCAWYLGVPGARRDGVEHWLGVVNTHTTLRKLRWYGGVAAGGVGAVLYEDPHARRKIPGLDVRRECEAALDTLFAASRDMLRCFDRLRQTRLEEAQAMKALYSAARRGTDLKSMTWSRIGRVESLFNETDGTAWELLVAFNRVMVGPGSPDVWQPDILLNFCRLVCNAAGVEQVLV
jgi:hypothetical protein